MNNWNNQDSTKFDLSDIKENSVVSYDINFTGDEKNPPEVVSTYCGCTQAIYSSEKKVLTVTFKAGTIPLHLISQGFQSITHHVSVIFKDGTRQILVIVGKVVK